MENKMNKFGLRKMLAVLAIALACVCMWGCGDDKVSFDWGKYRSDESIAGFIDDLLVIVTDCRRWHKNTEGWNGSYSEETSCGHDRMLIYNYRVQEDGPRWTDSLTNTSGGGYWKQLTDSIIWRWDGEKQDNLMLWKIGLPATELKIKKIFESCSGDFEVNRMHQWLNETFIALGGKLFAGGDSCQYAVLDTTERTLTYKRLNENLEWIKECDDVRAWGGDVYCFMPGERNFEAVLLRNSKDTVDIPIKFTVGDFWGNVLRPNANLCNLIDGKVFCSGAEWRGGFSFYQNNAIVVNLE